MSYVTSISTLWWYNSARAIVPYAYLLNATRSLKYGRCIDIVDIYSTLIFKNGGAHQKQQLHPNHICSIDSFNAICSPLCPI